MTISPSTPPQGPSRPRVNRATPSREINFTNALAEVLLPRSVTRRAVPNKSGNRSPAGADVKQQEPKEEKPKEEKPKGEKPKGEKPKGEKPKAGLGTPLKQFDGNSVRDRVRKWQEEGGGVIVAQDPTIYPPEATTMASGANTTKEDQKDSLKSGTRKKEDVIGVGETTNRSKNSKLREGQGKAVRVTSELSPATPKKRVVSDEHWVKKTETASTPEVKSSIEKPKSRDPPKRCLDDDGIRVKAIRTSSARKRQPERETGSPSKPASAGDGIRVYTPPDSSLKHSEPKRAEERETGSPSKSVPADDGIRVHRATDSSLKRPEPKTARDTETGSLSKAVPADDGIRVKAIRTSSARRRQPERETGSPSKPVPADDEIRVYTPTDSTLKHPEPKRAGERETGSPSKPIPAEDGIRVHSATDSSLKRPESKRARERKGGSPRRSLADADGIRVHSAPASSPKHPEPTRAREEPRRSRRPRSGSESNESRAESRRSLTPPRRNRTRKPRTKVKSPEPDASAELSPDEVPKLRSSRRRNSTHHGRARSPRGMDTSANRSGSKSYSPKISFLREAYEEGRRILEKSHPQPLPRPPGNRIEAWLNETPDPFVNGHVRFSEPEPAPTLDDANSTREESMNHPHLNVKNDDTGVLVSSELPSVSSKGDREEKLSTPNRQTYRNPSEPIPSDQTTTRLDIPAPEADVPAEQDSPVISPMLKRAGAKKLSSSPTGRKRRSRLKGIVTEDNKSQTSILDSEASGGTKVIVEPFRGPDVIFKRPFTYAARPQLSTIASVETLTTRGGDQAPPTIVEVAQSDSVNEPQDAGYYSETEEPGATETQSQSGLNTTLKRRLTTHADLMSVLSLPHTGTRSIRSARSIRSSRSKLTNLTVGELLSELAEDERKYMRELNTLVDGVIPVLLTCVLSKSDSSVAAGLFGSPSRSTDNQNFTRPVIDMGIALERLRSLHKRIPLQDCDRLLHWAEGARKVYSEYIKCWRIGFQNVVINLAPATEGKSEMSGEVKSDNPSAREQSMDEGLPRNAEGDVVDGCGKRVDVAYLLKRPLVRVKHLAKSLRGVDCLKPSTMAEKQASHFQDLVVEARHRVNEESGRVEDEAAASIDASKARDPRTLAPLSFVSINPERRVNARDYFDLHFEHSSGQRLDCRVELLLREDPPGKGNIRDLLICEVDQTSRWLLFPPIVSGRYSARSGDLPGQMVVMLRGGEGPGDEWHELLLLITDDEPACTEWIRMLGLHPVPPAITHHRPVNEFTTTHTPFSDISAPKASTITEIGGLSPLTLQAIEVPIGEHIEPPVQGRREHSVEEQLQPLQRPNQDSKQDDILSPVSLAAPSTSKELEPEKMKPSSLLTDTVHSTSPPRDLNEAMMQAGSVSLWGKLRRTKAKRIARSTTESPTRQRESRVVKEDVNSQQATPSTQPQLLPFSESGLSVPQLPSPSTTDASQIRDTTSISNSLSDNQRTPEGCSSSRESQSDSSPETSRPFMSRRVSSVPSLDSPSIPKLRKNSPSRSTEKGSEERGIYSTISSQATETSKGTTNVLRMPSHTSDVTKVHEKEETSPPPPPPHRSPSPMQLKNPIPKLENSSPGSRLTNGRRSSSPLKHEYAPSSPSESPAEAQTSSEQSSSEQDQSTFSDTSEEVELEDGDAPTPLIPIGALHRLNKSSPQGSIYSMPNTTVSPSESASQAPYRAVPKQLMKTQKAVASIYSWSEKGSWERLHPDECSIVVMPGLIETREMGASHSKPIAESGEPKTTTSPSLPEKHVRPLVGQELTPMVQLRRGTALDISIRSPLTPESKLSAGSYIMYRSRSAEECEALYAMINYARINSPKYIRRQNERAMHVEVPSWAVNRQASVSRSSRWSWRSRRNRGTSSGAPASVPASESSVGTATTAFSALKLFGSGGRFFNIAKSTISSRKGSASNSLYSSSSGSGYGKGGRVTPLGLDKEAPIGGSDFKVRLYCRLANLRWGDMGKAQLSIRGLPPGFQEYGLTGEEKRIILTSRSSRKRKTLLDVCLPPTAFRRVARTGLAISIVEEAIDENGQVLEVGAEGGVGQTTQVYMLQIRSETQTAYIYSFLGVHEY